MTTPRVSFPGTPSASSAQDAPAAAVVILPIPNTFDIIPQLHSLLSRLLQVNVNGLGIGGPTPSASGVDAGQDAHVPSYLQTEPLNVKHLEAAATDLKLRIQKMRMEVGKLPDVGRGVDDQEEEIEHLRGKVQRLRAVLTRLNGQKDGTEEVARGERRNVEVNMEE